MMDPTPDSCERALGKAESLTGVDSLRFSLNLANRGKTPPAVAVLSPMVVLAWLASTFLMFPECAMVNKHGLPF